MTPSISISEKPQQDVYPTLDFAQSKCPTHHSDDKGRVVEMPGSGRSRDHNQILYGTYIYEEWGGNNAIRGLTLCVMDRILDPRD
jgi:hypothetical protein